MSILVQYLCFKPGPQLPIWLYLLHQCLNEHPNMHAKKLLDLLVRPTEARNLNVPYLDDEWLEPATVVIAQHRKECAQPLKAFLRWLMQHPKVKFSYHVKSLQRHMCMMEEGTDADPSRNLLRASSGWLLYQWWSVLFQEYGDWAQVSINLAMSRSDLGVLILRTAERTFVRQAFKKGLGNKKFKDVREFVEHFAEQVRHYDDDQDVEWLTDNLKDLLCLANLRKLSNITLYGPREEIGPGQHQPSKWFEQLSLASILKYSPLQLTHGLWQPSVRRLHVCYIEDDEKCEEDTWWSDTISSQATICTPCERYTNMLPLNQALNLLVDGDQALEEHQPVQQPLIEECLFNPVKNATRDYWVDSRPAVKEHTLNAAANEWEGQTRTMTLFRFIDCMPPSKTVTQSEKFVVRSQTDLNVKGNGPKVSPLPSTGDPWRAYTQQLFSFCSERYWRTDHVAVHNVGYTVEEFVQEMPAWLMEMIILWHSDVEGLCLTPRPDQQQQQFVKQTQGWPFRNVLVPNDVRWDPYAAKFEPWWAICFMNDEHSLVDFPTGTTTDAREIIIGDQAVRGKKEGEFPKVRCTRIGLRPTLFHTCSYIAVVDVYSRLYKIGDRYCFMSRWEFPKEHIALPVMFRRREWLIGVMTVEHCDSKIVDSKRVFRWWLSQLAWFPLMHLAGAALNDDLLLLLVIDHETNLMYNADHRRLGGSWSEVDVVAKWSSLMLYKDSQLFFD